MKLGTQVGLGPGHIVLDGNPAPPPQRAEAPSFRPICVVAKWLHGSRCHLVWRQASAQMTLCQMRTPIALPKKGAEHPKFWVHIYCGQTAGWIKMPLGTEVGLSPGDFVLDGDPPLPQKPWPRPHSIRRSPRKGHSSPLFSAYVYCGHILVVFEASCFCHDHHVTTTGVGFQKLGC